MVSFYRLNVSKNGKFFFRIDQTYNLNTVNELKNIMNDLEIIYPSDKGYEYTITLWEYSGSLIKV